MRIPQESSQFIDLWTGFSVMVEMMSSLGRGEGWGELNREGEKREIRGCSKAEVYMYMYMYMHRHIYSVHNHIIMTSLTSCAVGTTLLWTGLGADGSALTIWCILSCIWVREGERKEGGKEREGGRREKKRKRRGGERER